MMSKNAQTIIEYLFFISIVTIVLFSMGTGIKRGLQSLVKVTADQIGNQEDADQKVSKPIDEPFDNVDLNELESELVPKEYDGYLVESYTAGRNKSEHTTTASNYTTTTDIEETSQAATNTITDLGFTQTR